MTRFFIVTPILNAERLIDETVVSVLSQAGSFDLHYHVQDGGSTDATIDRLKIWSERLKNKGFPILCNEVNFTYATRPDSGLYQGLNHAFQRFDGTDDEWMTWINAGDRLEMGALATVASVAERYTDILWLGGLLAQCTPFAGLTTIGAGASVRSRQTVAAGLHDGTHFGFIQQEGTFWRRALWRAVGSHLNDELSLAGDFDLWRRFAAHAALLRVRGVLGVFRHHPNRLVSDPARYLAEVQTVLDSRHSSERLEIWDNFQRLKKNRDSVAMEKAGFYGDRVVWDRSAGQWRRERLPVGLPAVRK